MTKLTDKEARAATVTRLEREPMTHELKTRASYFHAVSDGTKNFELRKFDRDFRSGDTLRLRETDYGSGAYTGREVRRKISYVLAHEDDLGLMRGFAILSLEPLTPSEAPLAPVKMAEDVAVVAKRVKNWKPYQYASGFLSDAETVANSVAEDRTTMLRAYEALLAENARLSEQWVDENGLAWSPPTAWAYAQVCKARDKWQAKAAEPRTRVPTRDEIESALFKADDLYLEDGPTFKSRRKYYTDAILALLTSPAAEERA